MFIHIGRRPHGSAEFRKVHEELLLLLLLLLLPSSTTSTTSNTTIITTSTTITIIIIITITTMAIFVRPPCETRAALYEMAVRPPYEQ